MTTRNIDEMISENETEVMDNPYSTDPDGRYKITIMNKGGELTATIKVFPDNTLGEVFKIGGEAISVRKGDGPVIFENEITKKTTSDLQMTVSDFGIGPGDKLLINGEGNVA